MSENTTVQRSQHSYFRQEAVEYYISRHKETILPRYVSKRTFLILWIALAIVLLILLLLIISFSINFNLF